METELNDDISFSPFSKELSEYSLEHFRKDLSAGFQVALLSIPQAMAYAIVAGLPLTCGFFAAIFSCIVAGFFGSSRHLVVGPVNAIAILLQYGVAGILYTFFRDAPPAQLEMISLNILAQLSLLVGVFQVLTAVFKLGRLTQFISHSVVVGYVCGVALTVILSQLYLFLGIPNPSGLDSLFDQGIYLVTHIQDIRVPTLLVGGGTLAVLLLMKKSPIPGPLIAIILATVAVFLFDNLLPSLDFLGETEEVSDISIVSLVGTAVGREGLWPHFSFPVFQGKLFNDLLPLAFAVTLLSTMESMCAAKSLAANTGQRVANNQEILSIGLGNLVSGFMSALPVCVSSSRSGMNVACGAKTRLATIFNGIFVAAIIYLFGSFVQLIPMAALSALLLITAANLINVRQLLLCLKSTSADAYVLIATLMATLFFSLDMAFYIGVVISIISYLNKAATPQLVEYAIEETGELKSLDPAKAHLQKVIRVIKVEGELFFGAADLFETTLKTVAENDNTTRVIILQMKNARDMDATTCLALLQLHGFLNSSNCQLIACGMTHQVWDVMSNSGVIQALGKENLFLFDDKHPHLYMQRALSRARELIQIEPIIEEPVALVLDKSIQPETSA